MDESNGHRSRLDADDRVDSREEYDNNVKGRSNERAQIFAAVGVT